MSIAAGLFLLGDELMKRAYAVLEIRSTDDDKRIIEGIANTAAIDSYQTILEPEGAEFTLPLPALYQHNSRQPIGHVVEAKVSKGSIRVKVQVAKTGVAGFIDEAWALIKNGLVRGLSVGFEPIEEVFDKTFNGFRYPKWKWHELSMVTIPANQEATMSTVRSADEAILAALGTRERASVSLNPPGVSGLTQGKAMKTIQEHIAALETKRAANDVKMDGILQKCADEGRSRDAAEQEEFDNLQAEQRSLDADIKAFQEREKAMVQRAAAVTVPVKPEDPEKAGKQQRQGLSTGVDVRKNEPKGIGIARMAIAMVRAGNNPYHAAQLAEQHWKDSPEVAQYIRTVIEAGDTTTSGWASQLLPAAQNMSNEFLDLLRAQVLIGRIPGLRQVPFNISVTLQSGGGTYQYVGEGAAKPVSKLTIGSATLRFEKAAGIIAITQELARFSNPSAELIVRDDMVRGMANFFDTIFVSNTAAVSNVQPAGILNGITATPAGSANAAGFIADMNTIIQLMITNNRDVSSLAILMSAGRAMSLASIINSLGQPQFPTITAQGGNYLGIPIITSQALLNSIILIDPSDILIAEDPAVSISVSDQATLEMDSSPVAGDQSPVSAATTMKSLWQNNLIGIRAEQYRTWKVARSTAVEWISNSNYKP